MTLTPASATRAPSTEEQSKPDTLTEPKERGRFDLLFELNQDELAGRLIGHELALGSI